MRVSILTVAIVSVVFSTQAAPIGRHYGLARGYRRVKARGMAPTPAAVLAPRQAADNSEVASEVFITATPSVDSAVTESFSPSEIPFTDDEGIMEDQYPVIEPTDYTNSATGTGYVAYNNVNPDVKQGALGQPECQPCTADVCAAVCIPVGVGAPFEQLTAAWSQDADHILGFGMFYIPHQAEDSMISSQSGNTVTVRETTTCTKAAEGVAVPTSALVSAANGDIVDEGRSEVCLSPLASSDGRADV